MRASSAAQAPDHLSLLAGKPPSFRAKSFVERAHLGFRLPCMRPSASQSPGNFSVLKLSSLFACTVGSRRTGHPLCSKLPNASSLPSDAAACAGRFPCPLATRTAGTQAG
eukprot:2817668-Pleurochrysis_carterae.AAC.1